MGLDVRRGPGRRRPLRRASASDSTLRAGRSCPRPLRGAQSLAPHPAVGTGIGLVLALTYLFQTAGLLFTSPTSSGLITGLFVVFAPLAGRLFFGARPSRAVLVTVFLSLVGIVLLSGGGPDGANPRDVFTLLCAGALGPHVALLSRYAVGHDAGGLAFVQLLSMALAFGLLWPLSGLVILPLREVWLALLATGLVASAVAFWVQTFVQHASSRAGRRSYLLRSPSSPFSSDTGSPATGWLQSRWPGQP